MSKPLRSKCSMFPLARYPWDPSTTMCSCTSRFFVPCSPRLKNEHSNLGNTHSVEFVLPRNIKYRLMLNADSETSFAGLLAIASISSRNSGRIASSASRKKPNLLLYLSYPAPSFFVWRIQAMVERQLLPQHLVQFAQVLSVDSLSRQPIPYLAHSSNTFKCIG